MSKNLKKKFKDAMIDETPDFKKEIISACENQTQVPASTSNQTATEKQYNRPFFFRRIALVMSCIILFGAGLLVGKITPQTQPDALAQTHVYIDVNPSLELSLDSENVVLSCTAVNQDAEIILNGMKLEGVELKTAVNAIVGSMYVNGYLTQEDNSMLISVESGEKVNTSEFLNIITKQVNDVFENSEMECAIIAQEVKATKDLKQRAKEQGVSIGKMRLLDKMIDDLDDLTHDDVSELSKMSIKDLNLIYSQKTNNDDNSNGEVISGSVNVNVSESQALNSVLEQIGKTVGDVEHYRVFILPSKHGEFKAVYVVTLKFFDGGECIFEVDFQTGNITARQTDDDLDGGAPNGNGDNPHERDGQHHKP